jgi:hypothetical protein
MTPADILRLVEAIVCVGVAIASMEMFFVRDILKDDGFLSWRVNRLTRPRLTRTLGLFGLDAAFDYPNVLVLIALRTAAAAAVVGAVALHLDTRAPLAVAVVCTLLLTLRGPQGNDGSDQMASILLIATLLGELVGTGFSRAAAVLFIAVESAFAYATAGFLKVPMKGWRDGSYVLDVLRTGSFGHPWILRTFEAHRPLAVVFGLGVAFGDSAIAFAAVLPPSVAAGLLAFGVILHLGIAAVLGLNTFVWSFVATYPAVLYVSHQLYGGHP